MAGAVAMSRHAAFRRQAVPDQAAQKLASVTLPAPTRGIIENENLAYMQKGGAQVCDNWFPTQRGVRLRGGFQPWATLPVNERIISGFTYISGSVQRMFVATADKLFECTFPGPVGAAIATGRLSGNYSAAQLANMSGDYLTAVNDAGDFAMRFDGTTWVTLNSGQIVGPPATAVVNGRGLTYVWKYRRRLFFIEGGTMNAWYLDIDAIQGTLKMIPLSGSCKKGGSLLFGATWSIDAGDGIDDKCVFATTEGELVIFTGSDPSNAASWRQEGLYEVSKPMGMNAHTNVGGDLLIATVDGIVPISQAISKDIAALQLSAVTRTIETMWKAEVADKNDLPWTMCKWDEFGGLFVTWPGAVPGKRLCAVANLFTGAWCRFLGWDAMCFMRVRGELFFGTQNGVVMHGNTSGNDDGLPYVATLVGGWEMFQVPPNHVTWHQARCSFSARAGEPFQPQVSACIDYNINVPSPPPAGPDPGASDVWDQGLWDEALWDADRLTTPTIRNTLWVSVGQTGYSHAPIVQVTVAQTARPQVELISIAATYERLGVNV
jgi:hypothetical protein